METIKFQYGYQTWTILKSEITGFSESNTGKITQVILKNYGFIPVDIDQDNEKKLREMFNTINN